MSPSLRQRRAIPAFLTELLALRIALVRKCGKGRRKRAPARQNLYGVLDKSL
ncbi:protein of unknown function [Cupriavidus neocaledonicus]|uniref:Transposase n=1 Tax=Cupriavidus neocaledonicus TaxID=1040979 RepID=A0A375HCD1_9BURK|nr:hypothetical protein CBM2605_A240041 [Cupriavidus neocaledonicus]SPD48009.1 protein of unknown function [Cupriavidus neocaledonicus]SPD48043.1 protein of unknown function [Cupriavidus neocaledonicus]